MYIWRVENKKGLGCYRYPSTMAILMRHNSDEINHPSPFKDKKIKRFQEEGEICGFTSLYQSLKWFSIIELINLYKLGFKLKKVKIEYITKVGEKQVLAVRKV